MVLGRGDGGRGRRCRRHRKMVPVTAGGGRGHGRVVQRRRESPVHAATADAGKGVVEWRLVMVVVSELRNELAKRGIKRMFVGCGSLYIQNLGYANLISSNSIR